MFWQNYDHVYPINGGHPAVINISWYNPVQHTTIVLQRIEPELYKHLNYNRIIDPPY